MRDLLDRLHKQNDELCDEAADEIESLRRDAERYRWLREKFYVEDACLEIGVNIYCHECPNKADINSAIDAAMLEE